MSTPTEKLEALRQKVNEYRDSLTTKSLLEAMGFFALVELLEKAHQTGIAVTENLKAHIGAMFEVFSQMFDTRKKVNSKIHRLFKNTPA